MAWVALVMAAGLAGCAAGNGGPEVSMSADPTVSVSIPADAPQTYEEAEASADALILSPDEVPGGGWEPGGPVAVDDFRQVVCGVDVEPNPPAGAFVARRVQPNGLTLFQTVRPVGASQAAAVVAGLAEALPTCTTDERVKGGQTLTYAMAPVALESSGAVAYRQHRTDTDQGVWSYLVYFAARDSLVAFTTFSTSPEPAPTQFLDELVRAVRRKG